MAKTTENEEYVTKTFFSKRILKSMMNTHDILFIQNILHEFNQMKHYAYSLLLKEHNKEVSYPKSVYMMVKSRFPYVSSYYLNSALEEAKANLSSQVELNKQYQKDTEEKIKTVKKKIKEFEKRIENNEKLLTSIIKSKGAIKKVKFYKGSPASRKENTFVVRQKRRTLTFENMYVFEMQYVKPLIKKTKFQLKNVKAYVVRLERTLKELKTSKIKGACFGSIQFFNQQFTHPEYVKHHDKWKAEIDQRRYGSMRISGRFDAEFGNYVFKYNHHDMFLHMDGFDKKPTINFSNLEFPYGKEELFDALAYQETRQKPIAWTLEDHGDYYIMKATVQVPVNKNINYYTGNGLIGIDCNVDHFSWTETDNYGNLIDHGVIAFDLFGKPTGQITKIIETAVIALVNIAEEKNKPMVIEDLDTTDSKAKLRYKNKKANQKISQFAYQKMQTAIYARANKVGVYVGKVAPQYTSKIGKMKYMKQYGVSIHTAAAFVIARRKKFKRKEKLPTYLKPFLTDKLLSRHHWSHWSSVSRSLKDVPTHQFFKVKEEKFCACNEMKEVKKILLSL